MCGVFAQFAVSVRPTTMVFGAVSPTVVAEIRGVLQRVAIALPAHPAQEQSAVGTNGQIRLRGAVGRGQRHWLTMSAELAFASVPACGLRSIGRGRTRTGRKRGDEGEGQQT
jgi:hypothetical protein